MREGGLISIFGRKLNTAKSEPFPFRQHARPLSTAAIRTVCSTAYYSINVTGIIYLRILGVYSTVKICVIQALAITEMSKDVSESEG